METLAIVLAILAVAITGQRGFASRSYIAIDEMVATILLVAALTCGIIVAIV